MMQFDDPKYRQEATRYYFQSDLYKVEFPLYVKFVRNNMSIERYFKRLESISSGNVSLIDLYWMQRLDPYYQSELNREKLIPADSLYFMKWQENRRHYLSIKYKDSAQAYGYIPVNPTASSAFFSLFMNNNIYQFITNIIFL